jgi:glutamate-ammonia-ligase adenylyltransferase
VDLIFLADESLSADEREPWRRLAEHLLHLTGSHTREGLLFPVDTRLRPRGQEGEILQSVDYLCRYLQTEALGWEAVSWLKALPVAGNLALAGRALAQANAVLQRRWCPQDAAELRAQLIGLRGRLEREGTGPRSRTEFKHIAGGFFDLEYITGLLFFRAAPDARVGRQGPLPAAGRNILEQLAQLHAAGLLAAAPYEALCRAAVLFRSVDHAHRLITGRAANRTPDPALAERIARLLAQWSVPLVATGAEGLLATLAATRRETRSIYSTFF